MGLLLRLRGLLHRLDTLEQIQHARNSQPVENLRTALLIFQNSCRHQLAEVARHCWRFDADHVSQFTNTTLPAREFVHDKEPRGMGERLHDLCPRLVGGMRRSCYCLAV